MTSFVLYLEHTAIFSISSLSLPQTLEPLPTRQQVAELPVVNWNGYMESVEKIVRQHSSVCQRTRRRGLVKEPTSLTKMVGPSLRNPSGSTVAPCLLGDKC